jgi:hypothetical protein
MHVVIPLVVPSRMSLSYLESCVGVDFLSLKS